VRVCMLPSLVSPTHRSAADVTPEQPEGKRSKPPRAGVRRRSGEMVKEGWMIEQRESRGVKHQGDKLSHFREPQFDG